mgnify:CR=1 FL=1
MNAILGVFDAVWQEEEVEEASFEGVGRKELVIKLVGFEIKVEVKGMFEED